MQGRKTKKPFIDEDDDLFQKKSFLDRHPGLKWTMIGAAIGLFAAAIALPLAVTLGAGVGPFVLIGAAFGLTDLTLAATVGMAVITGAAMTVFGALLGTIAAIASHCKGPSAAPLTRSHSAPRVTATASTELTHDEIAKQQAQLRAQATGPRMFSAKTPSNQADVVEENRLAL